MTPRYVLTLLALGLVTSAAAAPVTAAQPATACPMHQSHSGAHPRVSCGLERLGQVEVSPTGGTGQVAVRDGLAAVVQREDGAVALVDVRDPAAPRVLGRYDGGTGRPELDDGYDGDVAFSASGRYVFHAHQTHQFSNDGLHVLDVSDPTAPRRAAYAPGGGALRVAAHSDATGEYVVLLDAVAGLVVYRFEPTTAVLVAVHVDALPELKVGGPGSAGVHVDPRDPLLGVPLLYVSTGKGGLDVYDFSVPAAPRRLGSWAGSGLGDIAVRATPAGRTVYAATEYWFTKNTPPRVIELDATDLGRITERRRTSPGTPDYPGRIEWEVQGMALGARGLYVAHSHGGLGVLGLDDLERPVASTTDLGEGNTGGEFPTLSPYAMDVAVVGETVLVTDAATGTLTTFRHSGA